MLRFEMGPFARETRRPLALWMAAWALPALGACGSSTHDSGPDGSAGSAIAGAGMSGGAMSGGGYGGMTRVQRAPSQCRKPPSLAPNHTSRPLVPAT